MNSIRAARAIETAAGTAPDLPWLAIPVEIAARELDAKLLLAGLAVARGFPVIIGRRLDLDLYADKLPLGIRLEKGITAASFKNFSNLKRLGYRIVAWDEEALVYHSDKVYQACRMSRQSLKMVDALLAWGDDNERVWRSWRGYDGTPIVQTGNARVDMLRPDIRGYYKEKADRLRADLGNFILINSNFSSVNFQGKGFRSTKFDRYVASYGAADLLAFRQALFSAFLELVPQLAARFPGTKVVVRPHPAEDHRPWQEVASRWPNVLVLHEGPAVPWLIAAGAVIHNGCTTAIETFLLGRPAIAYQPLRSALHDIALPNDLSHHAFDLNSLLPMVERRLSGAWAEDRELIAQGANVLAQHINLQGGLSCDRILDVVTEVAESPSASPASRLSCGVTRWRIRRKRKRSLRDASADAKTAIRQNIEELRQRSFPALTETSITAQFDALRHVEPRIPALTVDRVLDNVFRVTRGRGGSQ